MGNSKLDRRTKYSLHVIKVAMFDLLESQSLDSITVTDICKKADINRGTFYKYYRDVYDLFEKIENDFIEELHILFAKSKATGSSMSNFFNNVFRILSENKELVKIAKNRQFSEHFTKKLLIFAIPQINKLIENSDPTASQMKIDLLSEYIMGGCTRVVAFWIENDMQIPVEHMEKYITDFITKTLKKK